MRFHLRAITNEGRIESLDFQAVDEQSARQQAESRGYTVLQVQSRRSVSLLRQSRFPVQLFSQELLVLLSAGLPLVDKPTSEPKWNGPYLKKAVPLDPWGKAYIYKMPGEKGDFDLLSFGRDGAAGGSGEDADITNR